MIAPHSLVSIVGLRNQGFEGFVIVASLRCGNRSVIPNAPGVYLFLRDCESHPEFLTVRTGGRFQNRNPNKPLADLASEWVEDTLIVYVGQTGSGTKGTLNKRIDDMIRFGQGTRAGHWGGRLIWQLAAADQLLVFWRATYQDDPRSVEKELLKSFKSFYGNRLPFASWRN
ncbi:MAG: hypothetical protein OXF79_14700 [Chloroflexi bacterium]|nr:hypothetical protein [Chloroflexota bacterium]